MDQLARDAYGLSHLVAIVCLLYARWWKRYPALLAYVIVDTVVALSYAPESKRWISDVYLRVEPFALLLRFLCAVEATRRLAPSRNWLIAGCVLIGASFALLLAAIEPGSIVLSFVMMRRYVQIGTAIQILTGLVILRSFGMLRWNVEGKHALILLALLTKQAIYSLMSMRGPWPTKTAWQAADWPGLLVTSSCLLLWSALALSATRARSA